MRSVERRQLWGALAAATVAGALLSVATEQPTLGGSISIPCGNSSPQCDGACPAGQICTGISRGGTVECQCTVVGCCQLANNSCFDNVTALGCLVGGIQFVQNGSCGVDCVPPTQTPTPTPTVTPTRTGIPNGGGCISPTDCMSGNCVDEVCCDTACNGALQSCNQPGSEGICSEITAPAPAASPSGLLLIVLVLGGIGAVAFWRRRLT